jgi:hypothetical protein
MTNFDIESELLAHLGPNETFVWTGRPKPGIRFRATDFFLIPFSLLWGGFAIFWESTVIATNSPVLFKLWGIPFVLVGLYMIVGRFFVDALRRSNTLYAITNERILIRSGIRNREIKSINIKTLDEITLQEKSDHSGTILLGATDLRYSMRIGWEGMPSKFPPQLEMIDDVKTVYDTLLSLQKK